MQKLFFYIFLIVSTPSLTFAYTEEHYVTKDGAGLQDGTSLANAFSQSDFNTSGNWDTDDSADNKIGPNDVVYFYDDDGDFTVQLSPQQPGLSGKPITMMAATGETVVVKSATENTHGIFIERKALPV